MDASTLEILTDAIVLIKLIFWIASFFTQLSTTNTAGRTSNVQNTQSTSNIFYSTSFDIMKETKQP